MSKKSDPSVKDVVVSAAKDFAGGVLKQAKLMEQLAAYEKEPAGAGKAARDLNSQEAFDLLMHLAYLGEVELDEPIQTDKKGVVTYPRATDQIRILTRMAGVEFYRASDAGFPGNYKQPRFTPTAAFAIVLHRLAKLLGGAPWNASRIVWGGIGSGAEGKKKNCHEIGTCVDFYGAYTSKGTFDVLEDWGHQPVYLKDNTLRPVKALEIQNDDKWGNETGTYFRLKMDDLAFAFFGAVYQFAYDQTTVGPLDVAPISFLSGQTLKAGKVMYPDYPTPIYRRPHHEHMHFQLGEAFV